MTRTDSAIAAFSPERLGALYSGLRAITEDPHATCTMRMSAATGDVAATVRWQAAGTSQVFTKALLYRDVMLDARHFDRWAEQMLNDVEQAHTLVMLTVPAPPPDDPTTLRGRLRAAGDAFRSFVAHLSVSRAIRKAGAEAPYKLENPNGDT